MVKLLIIVIIGLYKKVRPIKMYLEPLSLIQDREINNNMQTNAISISA